MHSAKPDTRGRRGENPPKNPTRHPAHVWPRLIATPAVRGAGPRTAPPAGRPHPAQRPRSAARAPCAAAERRQRAGPGGCEGTAAPVPPQDAACCAGRPLRPLRPRAKAAQPRRSPSRLGKGGGQSLAPAGSECAGAAGRQPAGRPLAPSHSPSLPPSLTCPSPPRRWLRGRRAGGGRGPALLSRPSAPQGGRSRHPPAGRAGGAERSNTFGL